MLLSVYMLSRADSAMSCRRSMSTTGLEPVFVVMASGNSHRGGSSMLRLTYSTASRFLAAGAISKGARPGRLLR